MQALRVRDLMTSPVRTIHRSTRLPTIKRIMWEHGIHRLPVVEDGQLLGIVTLGDLRNAFPSDLPGLESESRPRLDMIRAGQLMRSQVITVAPEAAVTAAAELMLRRKVSGLPVLAEGRLVGILTKSDLCRAVLDGRLVAATPPLDPSRPEREIVAYPALDATFAPARASRW